jgi:hypothetical protein
LQSASVAHAFPVVPSTVLVLPLLLLLLVLPLLLLLPLLLPPLPLPLLPLPLLLPVLLVPLPLLLPLELDAPLLDPLPPEEVPPHWSGNAWLRQRSSRSHCLVVQTSAAWIAVSVSGRTNSRH